MKSIGAGGAIPTLSKPEFTEDALGIPVLEVGIRFEVDREADYRVVHKEGTHPFYIDQDDRAVVRNKAPSEHIKPFKSGRPIVSGAEITNPPTDTSTMSSSRLLPKQLSKRHRPMYFYYLDSEYAPPKVSTHIEGDVFRLSTEENDWTIAPNSERSVELPSEEISLETVEITNEIVEVPGVRKEQWGPRKEFNSVEVTVTPVVEAHNRGECETVFQTV